MGLAFGIDDDFAVPAQLQCALEPFRVGHQANLHEHAFQRDGVDFVGGAIFEFQAIDLLPVAGDFSRLGVGVDAHVGQTLELGHQHRVRFQLVGKLDERDMRHDACQVDGCFHA